MAVKIWGTSKLLGYLRPAAFTQIRTICEDMPLPEKGGIKYHGFTYYPRRPDFQDPPYEPTKLFLVRRLCKMWGRNPTERKILEQLNLDGKVSLNQHVTILKNEPETNALLWKIKHLVKIVPIKFSGPLPEDGDYRGTYLRDNGEFIISPKLRIDNGRLEASEKFLSDKTRFDFPYMREYLRRRWENPLVGDL